MTLTIRQICEASGARLIGNARLRDLTVSIPLTDSRSLTDASRSIFFAIRTSAGDGHNYIDRLYARGVRAFVVDTSRAVVLPEDAAVLECEDTLKALQAVGAYIRNMVNIPIIGITGSVGKTVVKEMLNDILAPEIKVARSPRSWNSQIGLPLSLWQLTPDSEVGLFEAGVSTAGEMRNLAAVLRPTIGVLTKMTDEHSRGFSSLAEKISEKCLLFESCSDIVVFDAPETVRVLNRMFPNKTIHIANSNEDICTRVVSLLGRESSVIPTLVNTRIDITDTPVGLTVAYDHYTCDLQGLATALDVMRRRIPAGASLAVILGDLYHPGLAAEEAYAELYDLLISYGVTRLCTTGSEISRMAAGYSAPLRVNLSSSPSELISSMSVYDFYNNVVYVNGSDKNAMRDVYTWLGRHRNVTRMEINLDALARNFSHYRSLLPPATGLIGMVKAGAYGCGALEVARTLQSQGADMVAVAVVDEGVELRQGGVTLPIIVLDPWCDNLGAIFANNLEPTLIDASEATLLSLEQAADSQGVDQINVHIKLDTGMHRVGLSQSEIDRFAEMLHRHPRIRVESIFSHLATADCPDMDAYTEMQMTEFENLSLQLIKRIGYPVKRHILNTAGITRYGQTVVYDFARLGIGLYGISPLDTADRESLVPVARLVTRVIAVRHCNPGDSVGYGCKGKITRPSVIGTLPVGYADGIDRRMGNGNAHFLIDGVMCPTVGNICMDLCMVDLTDCPSATSGETLEVEIFGPSAPIERLSDALGTIPYEILSRISPRVKRVYFRE